MINETILYFAESSSIFNKIPIVLFPDIAYNKGTENVAAY